MDVAVLVLLDITFRALNCFTVYLLFFNYRCRTVSMFYLPLNTDILPRLYVFPPRARI